MIKMLVLILVSLTTALLPGLKADTERNNCCHLSKSQSCEQACRTLISPYKIKKHVKYRLIEITKKCPQSETHFWNCLDGSELMQEFRKRKRKHHGGCCKEASVTSCEVECLTTRNISKLLQKESCNVNREPKFTNCIKKVHVAKRCCNGSNKKGCQHSCIQFFKNVRSDNIFQLKENLAKKCGNQSKQLKCALDNTNFNRAIQNVQHCCAAAPNDKCANECKRILSTVKKDLEPAIISLMNTCGGSITSPLYGCLLNSNKSPSTVRGKSAVVVPSRGRTIIKPLVPTLKKRCCDRARSKRCAAWCKDLHDWCDGLQQHCLTDILALDDDYLHCIQDPKEVALSSCLTDVFEPCQIGFKEPMKFCRNLNEHPMALFRRGDSFGDTIAKRVHNRWFVGVVWLREYKLIFKDITVCQPAKFKAMACLLATKPCDHRHLQIQVCRKDCEQLLTECLNHEVSMGHKMYTVKNICSIILPNSNQSNCISLDTFAVRKTTSNDALDHVLPRQEVTLPCREDPCAIDEMCVVNRDCNIGTGNTVFPCPKYKCIKGCLLNANSKLIIPVGEMARLRTEGGVNECYQVCECKYFESKYDFTNCKTFHCNRKRNCTSGTVTYTDGEMYHDRCNTCTCIDGNFECTNKNCEVETLSKTWRHRRHHEMTDIMERTAPCSCHLIYKPVCALNGMTYPNACLAKCSNISDADLNVGDCRATHPCDSDPCAPGTECIPYRRVCLSPTSQCQQHVCAAKSPTYRRYLAASTECSMSSIKGKVCGFDGVTYENECQSFDSGTGVDYRGPCLPENIRMMGAGSIRCLNTKCPVVDGSVCELFIPSGACCPQCGSALRLVYSKRDVKNHKTYISPVPIAVKDIVKRLRQQLQVVECQVYGHLTVENDLLFMVLVNSDSPTHDQVQACKTEAERFHKYINNSSPVTQTNYYLSLLKASDLSAVQFQRHSSANSLKYSRDLILLLTCLLTTILYLATDVR